jgi:hypothetical protein
MEKIIRSKKNWEIEIPDRKMLLHENDWLLSMEFKTIFL